MADVGRIKIDTYADNYGEDLTEVYDYEVRGKAYRVVITHLGVYEYEDGEEGPGWGARVEVIGTDERDNPTIEAIYKRFDDEGDFELYLDTVTDYVSYINTREYVDITTYGCEEDIDYITAVIEEVLGAIG